MQLLRGKYDADVWEYIKVTPKMANLRSCSYNLFHIKDLTKTNENTLFECVIIPANFSQRHGVRLFKVSFCHICNLSVSNS